MKDKMRNKNFILMTAVLLLSIMSVLPAEAQFLKKLSKGLEKVNKTIENVDKTLKQGNTSKQNGNNSTSQTSNQQTATQTPAVEEEVEEVADGQDSRLTGPTPFITPNTLFIEANAPLLESVNEDIFWVKRGNFYTGGEKYEFWNVDGTKLFSGWEEVYDQPEFNSGVVPMRKPSEGYKKGNICLLYSDGRIKDLNVNWAKVTNFKDGVAVVLPSLGSTDGAFYIDTTGKRIYPNIKVDGHSFNIIRPLRDGLRAYKAHRGEWGYIDANGVVKLMPKYKEARDFSEGYAWVQVENGVRHLIDKSGRKIFEVSDISEKVSDVVDGRFYVDEGPNTCYYDVKGHKLGCFDGGNRFYGGYAFVEKPKSYGDVNTVLIDTAMNVVRGIPWILVDVAMVSEKLPKFTKSGLANINNGNYGGNSYLIRPDASIVLAGFVNRNDKVVWTDEFKPVSDCGLFVGRIMMEDGAWTRLQGKIIMRTTGEVLCIVSENKGFDREYESGYPVRKEDLEANGGKFRIKVVDIDQAPKGKLPASK